MVGLLCLSLTACIPVVSHEYDVEGFGEKSAVAGCSQGIEVKLTTHPRSGIAVVFWDGADRIRPNHRLVSVSIVLSGDEVVRLAKPEVRVSSQSNSIPSIVPITTVRRASSIGSPSCNLPADAIFQQPDASMQRMSEPANGQTISGAAIDSVFVIDIVVSGDPTRITVQLPPLLVNDSTVEIPAATFLRKLALLY